LNSLSTAAPQRFVISEAGYMADVFCCQHPKMTKPTKNGTPDFSLGKPRRGRGFRPAAPMPLMWEV
jgi:hypothetical protein